MKNRYDSITYRLLREYAEKNRLTHMEKLLLKDFAEFLEIRRLPE